MRTVNTPVAQHYVVCTVLSNRHNCIYPNQVSQHFAVPPHSLEEYCAIYPAACFGHNYNMQAKRKLISYVEYQCIRKKQGGNGIDTHVPLWWVALLWLGMMLLTTEQSSFKFFREIPQRDSMPSFHLHVVNHVTKVPPKDQGKKKNVSKPNVSRASTYFSASSALEFQLQEMISLMLAKSETLGL